MRTTLAILFVSIIGIIACNSNETQKNQQDLPAATTSPANDPSTRLKDFYYAYISEKAQVKRTACCFQINLT